MPSQFFGLEIAHTGLTAFQASINTTANNVSNVETKGYSKQKVNLEAQTALRVYQKYGSTSTGVLAKDVTRSRDAYYDQKYWSNQAYHGYYEKLNYYLPQIENYYNDTAANPGFTTVFTAMYNSINQLKDNAGNSAVRAQVISDAKKLTNFFNSTASSLSELQETINDEIKSTVDNVNAIAQKIALLNKQINAIEVAGQKANDLRDSRDLLVDELSTIVSVEVFEDDVVNSNYPDMQTGATSYTVKLNGQLLVKDNDYHTLQCITRESRSNLSDVEGLYDIQWKETQAKVEFGGDTMWGSLKSLFMLRDGNDEENLVGKVGGDVTSSQVTLIPNSLGDITTMNMPEEGTLTVNGKTYQYNSFTFETDEDGKIVKYTFDMATPVDTSKVTGGSRIEIGDGVNYKGIPYYQNQMNAFLRSFAKAFNDVELMGKDLNGNQGQVLFVANDVNGERKFNWDVTASAEDGAEYNGVSDDGKPLHTYFYETDAGGITTKAPVVPGTDYSGENLYRINQAADDTYYRLTGARASVSDAMYRDPSLFSTTFNEDYYEVTDASGKRKVPVGKATATERENGVFVKVDQGVDAADLLTTFTYKDGSGNPVPGLLDLESKVKIYRGSSAKDFLTTIYADITVDTQEAQVFYDNFTNIQAEIDKQRQSISGVDEDEEAMDLVKFQNAYNLSAKVISVLAEMYDQLILSTGV